MDYSLAANFQDFQGYRKSEKANTCNSLVISSRCSCFPDHSQFPNAAMVCTALGIVYILEFPLTDNPTPTFGSLLYITDHRLLSWLKICYNYPL